MLVVEHLSKSFRRGFLKPPVAAVRDVSFRIGAGEAFGLMGNSGSGKSTVARLILRLCNADSGSISLCGRELLTLSRKAFSAYRRRMQIIFQQPVQALDPKQTVFDAIAEPLRVHRRVDSDRSARQAVARLAAMTDLSPEILGRYPHQISGGQAQRVVIARVLGMKPELLVADEPTSMLDVSAQAQILSLLKRLQIDQKIGILLISHDPAVIEHFCDRRAVIEAGEITSR